MFTIFIVLLAVIAVLFIFALTTYLPVPIFTVNQGPGEMIGKITDIKKLKGGLIKLEVTNEAEIDPALQQGNEKLTSCSVSSFAYLREGQTQPTIDDIVKINYQGRLYSVKGIGLNWVKSWEIFHGEIIKRPKVSLVEEPRVGMAA